MNNPPRSSGERDAILSRIKSALQTPTSEHVKHDRHPAASSIGAKPDSHAIQAVLPPVGPSLESRIDKFRERSESLKTEFQVATSIYNAAAILKRLAAELGWKQVAWQPAPLLQPLSNVLPVTNVTIHAQYDRKTLEASDVGVTVCDTLVAQTGSILLSADSAGGRALSVLPPHHVVVATAEQLLADLPAAYALFAQRYSANWPSFATFITGPSRTGDIERILVLGAHGPKKLTVILINDRNG